MSESAAKTSSIIDLSKPKTIIYLAVWISSGLVGIIAVAFAQTITFVQNIYFVNFERFPIAVSIASPLLFIVATWLVKKFAPDAKGSGIPQVLIAIDEVKADTKISAKWTSPLVSFRTAGIKIISAVVGTLGGASIGREGPTVQVSAAIFAWMGARVARFAPQLDMRTFLVAGSAAGVAAAFNTPIAGIAFAIEELTTGGLHSFKHITMLAIIISGIVAQGLIGNYLYFENPIVGNTNFSVLLGQSLMIGLLGGLSGGVFARILSQRIATKLPRHWVMRALVIGFLCSAIAYYTNGETSGSGYEVTKKFLDSDSLDNFTLAFPLLKLLTTALSYLSGMAGGIFSPCLSIGAGIGFSIAKIFGFVNFKACALFGMVAFFSGAIQAPLTAVIIVMEMTDEHILAMPFMIAAFIASSAGKRVMDEPLYRYLANRNVES